MYFKVGEVDTYDEMIRKFATEHKPFDYNGLAQDEVDLLCRAGKLEQVRLSSRCSYYMDRRLYVLLTPTMYDEDIIRLVRKLQYDGAGRKHPASDFMLQRDKVCNGGLYYNCNLFNMGINKSSSGYHLPRWNGNSVNASVYKNQRDQRNRDQNFDKLRVMNHGPALRQVPLRCAYSGVDVENHSEPEYPHLINRFLDLHHYLFKDRISLNKSGRDPSDILKGTTLSQADLVEFFGCLPLHKGKHAWIHDNFREQDISWWLNHWRAGHGYQPYVLRGAKEFQEVCDELGVTGITWDQFIRNSYLCAFDQLLAA